MKTKRNTFPTYDEDDMIRLWRDLAEQCDGETRERVVRLADQLQEIVWRRGVFVDKPRVRELSCIRFEDNV